MTEKSFVMIKEKRKTSNDKVINISESDFEIDWGRDENVTSRVNYRKL